MRESFFRALLPVCGQENKTLEYNPARCPLAPKNNLIEETIYQFFFGKR